MRRHDGASASQTRRRLALPLIFLAFPAFADVPVYPNPHTELYRHQLPRQRIVTDPSRLGPAPTGFWYRCDAPSGYFPYITKCRGPWRLVPAGPHR